MTRPTGLQRTTSRGRAATIVCLAVAGLFASDARAQLPLQPVGSVFEMTGFIQKATLTDVSDPFSGGELTLNNHVVVIPRNTIFQMPATSLTWAELFKLAPAPYGIGTGPAGNLHQTGLALDDSPKPAFTHEVTVQGNRVEPGGRYIAGLVFISQQSLRAHQGFINAIDYGTGEMRVGGTRVRLNDPIGRFGRAMSNDVRFSIDEDNPTVKSETGYPMCLPRTDPAVADDPLCPQGNRPLAQNGTFAPIFTMATYAAPTAAERQNPALRTGALDPWRAAPFEIGDYVTVTGAMVIDGTGPYLAATAVDANVGIFTVPGTVPSYIAIDVLLMGTGPTNDVTLAQEGAKRTRVEGFTTDVSTPVVVSAVDVNACTGETIDRPWTVQAIDPGPPTGAVAGRWRFRPGAPAFDLKGFPFLPPTREVHVISMNGAVTTMNDLSAGEYTAPNFEFILPENLGIGNPKVPANFETMEFLVKGSGPRAAADTGARLGYVAQLQPWPGAAAPARGACAPNVNPGPPQQVASGSQVQLDGSATEDANTPPNPLTYAWTQKSGTGVSLVNANTAVATFKAPTLAVGAAPAVLEFEFAVSNGQSAEAGRKSVTVTVNPPPDTVKPAMSGLKSTSTSVTRGGTFTLSVTATDNVAVTKVTFSFNGATYNATKSGTTWSAAVATTTAMTTGVKPVTATATDAAGNTTTISGLSVTLK